MSLTTRVLIGLFAGLIAGIAVSAIDSPGLSSLAVAIQPVGTLWVNAIRMTVVPLVVSSLIAGIASSGAAGTIGRLGARAIVYFVAALAAAGALTIIIAPPVLSLIEIDAATAAALRAAASGGSAATTRELPTFVEWIVSLVPANPFRAAADGSILPLIVFAVAFGIALTRVAPGRRESVAGFFGVVADAMLILVRWILELAPIGVFALALPLATRMGIAAAGAIAVYNGLVVIVSVLFMLLVLYPAAVLLGRARLRTFAQATAPSQAVALSSRSSMASLPAMMEEGKTRLGFSTELTGFFLPLAASIFRVGSVIGLTIGALWVAQLYGVPLGPVQIAAIAVTSILVSFSVPSVPGGSILVGVPVLLAARLPVEGIAILLAVDTIPDMLRTVANVTAHMAGASILSRGQRGVAADSLPVA
ncbi:MAG: dicarboxylate/amino acid:cation symporter [Gemmatimonadaceae bacterium]